MTYHDPVADLDPTMSNPKVQLIRRVKGILIGFELVTMVGLWVWGYQSGLEPYAALEDKPWFPIQEFLFFTLLMLLVMSITAIAFRAAEIRVTDNDSQKFVLANGSMKGAITTVVISLVLVLMVWWLPGSEQASSVLDEEKKGGGNNLSDLTYEFESQDVLLITETTTVTAQVTNNVNVTVRIYTKADAEAENFNQTVPNGDSSQSNPAGTTKFVYAEAGYMAAPENFGKYHVVVTNDDAGSDMKLTFKATHVVRQELLDMLLTMGVLFMIANGLWAAVAAVFRSRASGQSIYRET